MIRSAVASDENPKGEGASQVRVEQLRPEHEAAWQRFVDARPAAGVYHSLAWRDVTVDGLGHAPRYLCALDGEDVCGVLPLFEVSGLFGRRLVSMPMRDRGGVVARDDAVARALVDRAALLTSELGARYLELKGSAPMPEYWLGGGDWQIDRESWVTTRIDLRPGADALWKALSRKNTRWSIKKAGKNGVRIALDSSEDGMRTFHRLFVRTRCAMGIPPYPAALFLALHRHLVSSGRAQLLLAYQGDVPVHGLLSLLSKETFVPAYAAPQKQFGKIYATEAILWHSIDWAARNGFVSYDFGADSKLQAGLFAFKRKWGGVQHPMAYHYLLNGISEPPSFDSSGPAYRLVRALWQRLPVALARPLGGWVTRQLS